MEHIGIEVNTIGPADRPSNRIHRRLREVRGILEFGENAASQCSGKIEFPHEAVSEGDAQLVSTEIVHLNNARRACHGARLPKRLDGQ